MQTSDYKYRIKSFFSSGSLLSVLIIVNVAVWVLSLLLPLVDYLFAMPQGSASNTCHHWLALSSSAAALLQRPWTLLTYMFLHNGFWHILFNMLMLYVGGLYCCQYLGARRFGWIYFLSGIAGGLFYLLIYNIFPVGQLYTSQVVGASAAVLGVFIAVAAYIPNQEIQFWMVRTFTVKMKYMALAFVIVDLLSMSGGNAGGHIAHLGGALAGWLYVVAMRNGVGSHNGQHRGARQKKGPTLKKRHFGNAKKSEPQRPLTDEEYNLRRRKDQERVDAILDKISKSGYEHLTREEKEFLFKYKG